jgi:hypothetical protein
MSNRFNLRISIIIIIVGIGLLPTAFLVNGFIRDQVPANFSQTLLDIQAGATDYIEDNYLGLGIPESLQEIKKDQIDFIEDDIVRLNIIPDFLLLIRNQTIEGFPLIYNASEATKAIDDATEFLPSDLFFNNWDFQDNYSSAIEGISERMTSGTLSLNFTGVARGRLLNGVTYNSTYYPGLTKNRKYGLEMIYWLEFYSLAEQDLGLNRSLIQIVYNSTWSQLQNVSAYITTYLFDVYVKSLYSPLDIQTHAINLFYGQWANASFTADNIELDYFMDIIDFSLEGLEAGYPIPTNLSTSITLDLWDASNSSSFVNNTGIKLWYEAIDGNVSVQTALNVTFGLTSLQRDVITEWISEHVKKQIVTKLFALPPPYGFNTTTALYSENRFYEQWANGTFINKPLNIGLGYTGFEVGIPSPSNISQDSCRALFDFPNRSAFINKRGILKWIEAELGNTTFRNELITKFDLDTDQLDLILDWLFGDFKENIVANLVNYLTRRTLREQALRGFYQQFANGTIFPQGVDIADITAHPTSIKGWEIGLPIPSNLTRLQSRTLFDPKSSESLVNHKGSFRWFKAMESEAIRNDLNFTYRISIESMNLIFDYMMDLKENIVYPYTSTLMGIPMEINTFADNVYTGIIITSIIVIAVGVVYAVITQVFYKKR